MALADYQLCDLCGGKTLYTGDGSDPDLFVAHRDCLSPEPEDPAPTHYETRHRTATALPWTGTNTRAIQAWTGTRPDTGEPRFLPPEQLTPGSARTSALLYNDSARHWQTVDPGDWIVHRPDGGTYDSLSPGEFHHHYEPTDDR